MVHVHNQLNMYHPTHAHLSNPTNENESDTLWYEEFFYMQVHQKQTIPEFFSRFTLNVNISSRLTKWNCTSVAFIPGSLVYTGLPIVNFMIEYQNISWYLFTIFTISFKRQGSTLYSYKLYNYWWILYQVPLNKDYRNTFHIVFE